MTSSPVCHVTFLVSDSLSILDTVHRPPIQHCPLLCRPPVTEVTSPPPRRTTKLPAAVDPSVRCHHLTSSNLTDTAYNLNHNLTIFTLINPRRKQHPTWSSQEHTLLLTSTTTSHHRKSEPTVEASQRWAVAPLP
jgi:hypothetical protein